MKRKGMRLLFLGDCTSLHNYPRMRGQDLLDLHHDVRHLGREGEETQQSESLPLALHLFERRLHLPHRHRQRLQHQRRNPAIRHHPTRL